MPVCKNFGKEWSWAQIVKTLFRLKCPYCREKQHKTAASRWKNSVYTTIGIFIVMLINIFFNLSIIGAVIIGLIIIFNFLVIYPFNLKLSNEQEPFW